MNQVCLVRVRRVADLGVERYHRRHRRRPIGDSCALVRKRATNHQLAHSPELGDRSRSHLLRERLAMPAIPILDLGEAFAGQCNA
jgi:hypothetical protein